MSPKNVPTFAAVTNDGILLRASRRFYYRYVVVSDCHPPEWRGSEEEAQQKAKWYRGRGISADVYPVTLAKWM